MKRIIMAATIVALTGCAAPSTRLDVDRFELKNKGRVSQENVPVFTDCVLDGFQKSHSMMTNVATRQHRRATGFRVENYAGGYILIVSTDIFDDGRTEYFEAVAASLINLTGEREAYAECLKKHGLS